MRICTLVIRSVGVVCLMFGIGVSYSYAWTPQHQPFPDGKATVVVGNFCWSSQYCSRVSEAGWYEIVRAAVQEWNDVASSFKFDIRPQEVGDDPCQNKPGQIFVIRTDLFPGNVCAFDEPLSGANYGWFKYGQGWGRIYINTILFTWLSDNGPYRVLLHELGHALGLGHPNAAGQNVTAVMNTGFLPTNNPDTLQPDDIAGVQALWPFELIGFLENPGNGSHASGVGIISGWVCEAEKVIIVFNEETWAEAAYGTSRPDTQSECGDSDNGFGLLFNWNRLGAGRHLVGVYVDDNLLPSYEATVTVTTLGQEFLRGVQGEYVLEGFPNAGSSVVIQWNQSLQNFVIKERQ